MVPSTTSVFQSKVRKKVHKNKRFSLSCTNCQQRRVKCDRVKPCGACCAKGIYQSCEFGFNARNHEPVLQSFELERLRLENGGLKDENQGLKAEMEELKARLEPIDSTESIFEQNAESKIGTETLSTSTASSSAASPDQEESVFVFEYGTGGVPPTKRFKPPAHGNHPSVAQKSSDFQPQASSDVHQRLTTSSCLDKQQEGLRQPQPHIPHSQALQTPYPRPRISELPSGIRQISHGTRFGSESPNQSLSTQNALDRIARSGNSVTVIHKMDPDMRPALRKKNSQEPKVSKQTSPIVSSKDTTLIPAAGRMHVNNRPFSTCSSISNSSFDSTASFASPKESTFAPVANSTYKNRPLSNSSSNSTVSHASSQDTNSVPATSSTYETRPLSNCSNSSFEIHNNPCSYDGFPSRTNWTAINRTNDNYPNYQAFQPITTATSFLPETSGPSTNFPAQLSHQEPLLPTSRFNNISIYQTSIPEIQMTAEHYHTVPWSNIPPKIQPDFYAGTGNPESGYLNTTDVNNMVLGRTGYPHYLPDLDATGRAFGTGSYALNRFGNGIDAGYGNGTGFGNEGQGEGVWPGEWCGIA